MTNTEKLLVTIPKLELVEFMGLARMLGVKLYKDEKDEDGHFISRPFSEVLDDIMARFDKLDRTKKREILRLLKKATTKPIWRAGLPDEPVLDLSVGKEDGAPTKGDE